MADLRFDRSGDSGGLGMEVAEALPTQAVAAGPASEAAVRYHSLDALRAFALLLGVVFHAAESFEPGVFYWAVMDRSPSEALGVFRHACHAFRLEIFFLIAGFFAHQLYHRRGIREFIRNRCGRILVPFLLGWAVLYPLLVYLWLLGAASGHRLDQFGVPPEAQSMPLALLTVGFFLSGQFIAKFDLTHLWFLHQLLVLYGGVLGLRCVWRRVLDRPGRGVAWLDRQLAAWCGGSWNLVGFALVTAPMLRLMQGWSVDTPKSSLIPELPTTLLFGFLFSLGWLVRRQPGLLTALGRRWGGNLLVGCLMIWPTRFGVRWLETVAGVDLTAPWVRWAYCGLYALMMWGFVLGFLGLFLRFCSRPSAAWRYVADASYWIYLVHLPWVVWLQIQVSGWPLHWTLKYPVVLALAIPPLFLSYHCLVRSSFIGTQLNGRKHPFQLPWRTR